MVYFIKFWNGDTVLSREYYMSVIHINLACPLITDTRDTAGINIIDFINLTLPSD